MSIQIDNTNAGTLTLKPASSGSYTLTFPSAVAAGLSGTSFNGSSAVTIAIDSTVATKAQSFIISMIFGGI